MEVATHHDEFGVHAIDQHVGHKVAVAGFGTLLIELQQVEVVDTDLGEQVDALLVIGQK